MSGGSREYLCYKVESQGHDLTNKNETPLRRAFGEHLIKVAKALHDIEWVDDGDYGKGDDDEAIKAVFKDEGRLAVYEVLKKDAKELIDELNKHFNL